MIRLLVPPCVLACGFSACFAADAAQRPVYAYLNPGAACQLSIPTTDTQVRPKATGYRNESTTRSAFVICGYGTPTNDSFSTQLDMFFASIDGVDRTINCTAVSGLTGVVTPVYSTKSTSSTQDATFANLNWKPADFGMGGEQLAGGLSISVTCTLPPETAITLVDNQYLLGEPL